MTLTAFVLVTITAASPLQAQTFSLLYSFTGGTDGRDPAARLLRDGAGNLYGTTYYGGAHDNGTIFVLDAAGNETVLYSFGGSQGDGTNPDGGLVRDSAGNLYGETSLGGAFDYGTVLGLHKNGKESVLASFSSAAEGKYPHVGLLRDSAGNFYGTTNAGGSSGLGTVFEVDSTGKKTTLHSFAGAPTDGSNPYSGLIQDAAGNLYGVTRNGGNSTCVDPLGYGCGTVLKIDASGEESVLYSFTGGADGKYPVWEYLLADGAGNLYGTTNQGGAFGPGAVFRVTQAGKETVLYSFTGGADGGYPVVGLVQDASGSLYGVTTGGGAFRYGVVFMLDKTGNETVLHSFAGSDGSSPYGALTLDTAGNLYGTTGGGGAYGAGVVFKVTP